MCSLRAIEFNMKPFSAPYTVLTDRLRGRGESSKWIEYMITATCAIGYGINVYRPGVIVLILIKQQYAIRL